MGKGFFITIEGCEGAGKSTQIKRLSAELKKQGYSVFLTREPGGTKIGNKIREILLDPDNIDLGIKAEILLYIADRAQHVVEKIEPALKQGKIVISDRFLDSNIAYQGYGRGLEIDVIKKINKWVVGENWPDLTIFLDIDVATGLQRARDFSVKKDRLEEEVISFHHRVRNGYLELARQEEERYVCLDANCSQDQLSSQIKKIVLEKLATY